LENLYRHIHTCDDQEIVILLDGDDWLAHRRVLQTLNVVYAESHCWMTYGQYTSWPAPVPGYSRPIPDQITETNTFRKYDWCASHLRSFYAWLFKRINREDQPVGRILPHGLGPSPHVSDAGNGRASSEVHSRRPVYV
jgi:hypothetical protein